MARKRDDGKGRIGGRQAGTPNKITGSVKEWIAKVIDGNRAQFEADLQAVDPDKRLAILEKLLQYVTPKMQSASPDELLKAEYEKLEELLEVAPDEAVNEIVKRIKTLKK